MLTVTDGQRDAVQEQLSVAHDVGLLDPQQMGHESNVLSRVVRVTPRITPTILRYMIWWP